MLKLWDDTIEGHRAEARAVLANFPFLNYLSELDAIEDPLERVQAKRQALMQFEPPPSQIAVADTIPGPAGDLPVRLYLPENPRGMFLHLHGGGWTIGRPQISEMTNEHLATQHGLAVLSLEYRKAPENPYPAAPDDCEAAAVWMLEHGPSQWGTDRLIMGGESSGAHLALVTLLRLRDRHNAIDRVLGASLIFGCYDLRGTPSVFDNGGNPDTSSSHGLRETMDAFLADMPEAERRNPDVSPIFADLSGLPPCLISVGTYDHLLDDSLFLAARMAAAESPVDLAVYPDSPHGYTVLPGEMAKAHQERHDAWIASLLS